MSEPFIQAPELLTRRERARDAVITALLWAVYAYLWLPLVSLLAWLVGFELAYGVMVRAGGAEALRLLLGRYAAAILVIGAVVTGWSLVNRARFRGRNRRIDKSGIGDGAVAAHFGVPLRVLARLRSAQSLRIAIDESGRPRIEEPAEPAQAGPAGRARPMAAAGGCDDDAPARAAEHGTVSAGSRAAARPSRA